MDLTDVQQVVYPVTFHAFRFDDEQSIVDLQTWVTGLATDLTNDVLQVEFVAADAPAPATWRYKNNTWEGWRGPVAPGTVAVLAVTPVPGGTAYVTIPSVYESETAFGYAFEPVA